MTGPPLPGIEKNLIYPEIQEKLLDNGVRVLLANDRRLPRVSILLAVKAGYVCNPDDNLSLIPLAIDLIKEGTQSRSSRDIADFTDRWAIDYQGDASMEHSSFSVTSLINCLEPALELLPDLVLNPTFPSKEFTKAKIRWRSRLMARRSQSSFLAQENNYRTLFRGHPYSRANLKLEHLEILERNLIEKIYRQFYVPQSSYILFSGPLEMKDAVELSEHYFGDWKGQASSSSKYPPTRPLEKPTVHLIHRPASVQSTILVSGRGLSKTHSDFISLKVANQILGGGGTARLFLNLREDKGYTYGAYSQIRSYKDEGLFWAEANVKTESTRESVEEILKELGRMGHRAPSKKELQRCQSELVGAFIRQTESTSSIGQLEIDRHLYQLPADFYREFIPRIRETTREQVLKISQYIFDPTRVVITLVADRNLVESELTGLGKLHVYDTEGNNI